MIRSVAHLGFNRRHQTVAKVAFAGAGRHPLFTRRPLLPSRTLVTTPSDSGGESIGGDGGPTAGTTPEQTRALIRRLDELAQRGELAQEVGVGGLDHVFKVSGLSMIGRRGASMANHE